MWKCCILSADGITERTLCTVNSLQAAQEFVDNLNRNPLNVAWFEPCTPVGCENK